jgi:hypothetical protein
MAAEAGLLGVWLGKCGVGQPLSADEVSVTVVWLVACHDELLQLQLRNTSVFVMLACVSWLLPEESWLRSDLVVRPAACDASTGSTKLGGAANSLEGLDVQCLVLPPNQTCIGAPMQICNDTCVQCYVEDVLGGALLSCLGNLTVFACFCSDLLLGC